MTGVASASWPVVGRGDQNVGQSATRSRRPYNTRTMPKIAFITAGGAGMFCGSCMRDNTLAAQLIKLGSDIVLIPTYTPIRTDEANVSIEQVFFGGINVYLQQKWSLFRFVPRFL